METRDRGYTSLPPPPPPQLTPPPPSSSSFLSQYTSLDTKISPSVLLIIAILAVIFFLSGLLHLLIRYLLRPTIRDPDDTDTVTAFQGQLQQLFHLHDSGVDQSFIDTLPVFLYKSIVGGNKDPFDCAVCLCEFEPDDKLRLLPKCSHAFHIECIDTWLLSHSTCPLCRGSLLLPEFSPSCSPMVLVLESGAGESSREIVPDNFVENSHVGIAQEDEIVEKSGENLQKDEVLMPLTTPPSPLETPEMKVVAVKLGKFRNLNPGGEGSTSNSSNIDERRCFSMGSFEYVMDEKSMLQVAIKPPEKKAGGAKTNRRRLAMSECDCNSQREGFRGFERSSILPNPPEKRESFSFSKTWLRGKKEKPSPVIAGDGSKKTFSLNPEVKGGAINNNISKRLESSRIGSEFCSESEFDMDVEVGSYNNGGNERALSRGDEMPSFARRTLLWVIGRNQNHKVVNHI